MAIGASALAIDGDLQVGADIELRINSSAAERVGC